MRSGARCGARNVVDWYSEKRYGGSMLAAWRRSRVRGSSVMASMRQDKRSYWECQFGMTRAGIRVERSRLDVAGLLGHLARKSRANLALPRRSIERGRILDR